MIVLDFYGEKETIENPPKDYNDFKKIVEEKFLLQKEDVDELIFHDGTQEIKNQNDYSSSIKKNGITIKIDISQNSKLYKTTEENIKKENPKNENSQNIINENINEEKKKEEKEEKVIHQYIKCVGCKCNPIKGIRYKCTICPNFDYCEECEKKYSTQHGHPFLKIRKPNQQNQLNQQFNLFPFPMNNPFGRAPFFPHQFPNQRFPHHGFFPYGGNGHFC